MPETGTAAAEHAPASAAMAEETASVGVGQVHAGEHESYDFGAMMVHHNLAYPAWEPLHGVLLLVFDLPGYAARNQASLATKDGYAAADPAPCLEWAGSYARSHGDTDPVPLAKAMVVAKHESTFGAFPQALSFFTQQTFFGTVALVLLAVVLIGFARRRIDQLKPAGRIQHIFEAIVLFVRDDIVRPNIQHGDRWTAHFTAMFLAILVMNGIGMIPGTGTATGNIAVTTALAVTTLVSMLYFGMKRQGIAAFWINLVPVHFSLKPAELMIWLMLAGIELLGLLIKPTALAIRLFANMFADHTVLLAFSSLGLIIFAARPEMVGLSLGMSAFGLLMTTVIYFLVLLVVLIQAYVFTLLSAVFIGQSMHPEH